MNWGGYNWQGKVTIIDRTFEIDMFQCLSCKKDIYHLEHPKYCPWCGAVFKKIAEKGDNMVNSELLVRAIVEDMIEDGQNREFGWVTVQGRRFEYVIQEK